MNVPKHTAHLESDEELLHRYKQTSNLEILGQLYMRYMDLVYGVCLKYFKEPEAAKDSVMTIFEELTVKAKKHEVTFFKGWLYRLATNHCLMILRKKKREPFLVESDFMQLESSVHPEEDMDFMDREKQLNQLTTCIDQLPAEQQEAIRLFYLKEKSYKEISEQTRKDANQVRSYIQNGRRNLKICMEKTFEEKA